MKPIDQFGPDLDKFLDELTAECVVQWHSDLTKKSPKDTGDFSRAWNIEGGVKKDYKATHHIVNNLPYSETITFGSPLPPSWGGVNRLRDKPVNWFPSYWTSDGQAVFDKAVKTAEGMV
tara:strand:- start:117 stop:473 length:357 start_codon:yes stop_codon:yes gene_type:complete